MDRAGRNDGRRPSRCRHRKRLHRGHPRAGAARRASICGGHLRHGAGNRCPQLPGARRRGHPAQGRRPERSGRSLSGTVRRHRLQPALRAAERPARDARQCAGIRAARSVIRPRRRPAALLPRHRPRRTADAPPRRQALLRNLRTLRRRHAPHARRRGIYGHRGPRRPQRQTPHDMQPPEVKTTGKRAKTPEQALAALMRLCARAEKSQDDARRLMRGWGLAEREGEQVLARLVRDRFIDDGRYAEAFVRDKLRLSGWGEYKIRTALQRKRIDRELIDAALAQADRQDMAGRLRQQLERKMRTTRHTTQYELKTKLIRYGLSLGYDYETVLDSAAALVTDTETCDEF